MSEAPVRPEGIWCWGCARRFVYGGTPTSGPLAAIKWREGLCNKPDCGVWGIIGRKPRTKISANV